MTALILAPSPAQNASLHRQLPHLAEALDAGRMRGELEAALFAADGTALEDVGRPKPEVTDEGCSIHYTVRTRNPEGGATEGLVLGTMFTRPEAAAPFERERLKPIASRLSGSAGAALTATMPHLGMALSLFPVSGAHPTLIEAVDPARVTGVLQELLPEESTVVAPVELVTLRRSRGCVLRYLVQPGARRVFGKVGYPVATPDIQRAFDELAAADGLRHGSVVFPRGLGRSAELDETFVSELPGRPPDLEQETERVRVVDVAAAVAAQLHAAPIGAGAPHTLGDELARALRPVRLLGRFDPALAEQLSTMLEHVRELDARRRIAHAVFSHGSFAPSQLMFDGETTGLLDFERACQAEPAFDLGRFCASMRVTTAGIRPDDADDLAHRFLRRYIDEGGSRAALDRAPLFELVALVRTSAHSWLQLKTSRLQRALSVLVPRAQALGVSA